jgi:hypothetical protein
MVIVTSVYCAEDTNQGDQKLFPDEVKAIIYLSDSAKKEVGVEISKIIKEIDKCLASSASKSLSDIETSEIESKKKQINDWDGRSLESILDVKKIEYNKIALKSINKFNFSVLLIKRKECDRAINEIVKFKKSNTGKSQPESVIIEIDKYIMSLKEWEDKSFEDSDNIGRKKKAMQEKINAEKQIIGKWIRGGAYYEFSKNGSGSHNGMSTKWIHHSALIFNLTIDDHPEWDRQVQIDEDGNNLKILGEMFTFSGKR